MCERPSGRSACTWAMIDCIRLMSSKPLKGIERTASMPFSGSLTMGFCGTVTMTMGVASPSWRRLAARFRPRTLPCSRASIMTMSGWPSRTNSGTFRPSLTTSSSLMCDCALSRPRTYCATCGTSSTRRRRIWSEEPATSPTIPSAPAGRPARHPGRTGYRRDPPRWPRPRDRRPRPWPPARRRRRAADGRSARRG